MLSFMKMLVMLLTVTGFCSGAYGHSKITTTQPKNGEVLSETPAAIELDFGNKVRLTKVTLQRTERDAIDLDLSKYKGFENSFSLSNTYQGKGIYTVNWRGLSIDGHVMQGKFTFTVK